MTTMAEVIDMFGGAEEPDINDVGTAYHPCTVCMLSDDDVTTIKATFWDNSRYYHSDTLTATYHVHRACWQMVCAQRFA